MCSRGAGHAAADGAGAVPAGEAQDGAASDTTSIAIMGDVPNALAERNQNTRFTMTWTLESLSASGGG
jgi:hypothetical protein